MESRFGRFTTQVERPEPIKFAWPVVLVPEMFTTARHLAILQGYLATIGWEVYTPDLRSPIPARDEPKRLRFSDLTARLGEFIDAIGRDTIATGFGLGGLIALAIAKRSNVRAAVAIAPALPGFRSPLFMRPANLPAIWMGRALRPPRGATLFHFLADAEPFQREALAKSMVPEISHAAVEVARGAVDFEPAPARSPLLIIAGDSDPFAPLELARKLAERIGAQLRSLPGCGHWIVGGRAIERAIAEMQRFLVRSLGQDLLLLYPEDY